MRASPSRISRRAGGLTALVALCALLALLTLLAPAAASAQQVPDPGFTPEVAEPAHKPGRGPVVVLDEAHNNFHTASGRYLPFAELLRRDGYRVRSSAEPFTRRSLKGVRLLVVANARAAPAASTIPATDAAPDKDAAGGSGHESRGGRAAKPSAFTEEEVSAVREWVRGGGSLLLVADHMPMPGAASKLAAAFGVEWSDGFTVDEGRKGGTLVFSREDGTLRDHKVTRGRKEAERVERVMTFTGSAFRFAGPAPGAARAEPLLVLPPQAVSLTPEVAWRFTPETPRLAVGGWLQGAVLKFGKGRVALFGEAAMFTAQLAGPNRVPVGMNSPGAPHNARFLLNLTHWLTGKLK